MKKDSAGNRRLVEIILLFLRLGFTAFGGPVAHIAMYRDEVVNRRKWLTDQEFLDLIGITNLIPGPNSTEMVIHISYRRAGWLGFFLGGISFILPATLMVLALAWLYSRFGTTPEAGGILSGVQPVIVAIILQALWGLGCTAIKGPLSIAIAIAALVLYLFRIHPLIILLLCGIFVALVQHTSHLFRFHLAPLILSFGGFASASLGVIPFSLSLLFITFLKIGAVLYGSGYVLLAFLHADFVTHLGWLTDSQLLDAIAVGQITPGPVFTTATFIGYILGGIPGAILATIGIFLPSFAFVALSNSLIPFMRSTPWISSFLDGVILASLGLMAGVTWQLAVPLLTNFWSIGIILISGSLLTIYRTNTTWLILAGALAGLLIRLG